MKADERRLKVVAARAREYRRLIKETAPSVRLHVGNPEALQPLIEAARALDAALELLAE